MHPVTKGKADKLEDMPNIGKSIASDLRAIAILHPQQLATRKPMVTYSVLAARMGHRIDPCVLYVLRATQYYLESGEFLPWSKFTGQRKKLLASKRKGK